MSVVSKMMFNVETHFQSPLCDNTTHTLEMLHAQTFKHVSRSRRILYMYYVFIIVLPFHVLVVISPSSLNFFKISLFIIILHFILFLAVVSKETFQMLQIVFFLLFRAAFLTNKYYISRQTFQFYLKS